MATPKKLKHNVQGSGGKGIKPRPLSLAEERALLGALGHLLDGVQPSVGRPVAAEAQTLQAKVDARLDALLAQSFSDWYAENGDRTE